MLRRGLQQRLGGCLAAIVLIVAASSLLAPCALAAAPELSATATPAELSYGGELKVTGRIAEEGLGVGGVPLALKANAYPFRGFQTVAHLTSASDGSFQFASVRPDRNTRMRVVAEGAFAASSPVLTATVAPQVAINAAEIGPGRTRLSVRIHHAVLGSSAPVSARWYVAVRGTRSFHLAQVTPTRELSAGLTYASAFVDPPSERFVYRLCLNPAWERAMGPADSHGSCPQGDFSATPSKPAIGYQGEGRGMPVATYPSAGAIASAARFLQARAGRTSFAVVDDKGHLSGLRLREHFQSASVVKVMMLVAYLQMLNAHHRGLSAADNSRLYPMIHISDNGAASAVLGVVGSAALARVARESGMSDYAPGVGWWAYTQTSAADQARFFFSLERLIPPQFYAYARGLLSGIEPSQSWGIPPVARPKWQVFFKTGALPSEGLFSEVGRLERGGVTFTIAVFTTGDPSMGYGEETIQGVAAALLARSP